MSEAFCYQKAKETSHLVYPHKFHSSEIMKMLLLTCSLLHSSRCSVLTRQQFSPRSSSSLAKLYIIFRDGGARTNMHGRNPGPSLFCLYANLQ